MADRYWVGSNTNWNSTASWATYSGGPAGSSVPITSDVAIFDINSGTAINNINNTNQTLFLTGVQFLDYQNSIYMQSNLWVAQMTFAGKPVNVITTATFSLIPRSGGNATITGDTASGWLGVIKPFSSTDFNISGTFSLSEASLQINTSFNSTTYSISLLDGVYRNDSSSYALAGTAKLVFKGGTWSSIIRNSVDFDGDVSCISPSWLPSSGVTSSLRRISGQINTTGTFSIAYGNGSENITIDCYGMTFSNALVGSALAPAYLTLVSTMSCDTLRFIGYGSAFSNGQLFLTGTGSFTSRYMNFVCAVSGQWGNVNTTIPIYTDWLEVLTSFGGLSVGNPNLRSGSIYCGSLTIPSGKILYGVNLSSSIQSGSSSIYLGSTNWNLTGTWSGAGNLNITNVYFNGDYNILGGTNWKPVAGTLSYISGNIINSGSFSVPSVSTGDIYLQTQGMTFSSLYIEEQVLTSGITLINRIDCIDLYIPPTGLTTVRNFLGSGSFYITGTLYTYANTNFWSKTWNLNNSSWFANKLDAPYGSLIINNYSIDIGTFYINSAVSGTTVFRFGYNGTWSSGSSGRLKSSVSFIGDYNIYGDVWWQYLSAPSNEPSRTMSYVTGSINTQGSRLTVGELRGYNFANFDTNGMYWDALRFYYVANSHMTLVSDLNTNGTVSIISSSPGSTTPITSTGPGNVNFAAFQVDTNTSLIPRSNWNVGKLIGTTSTLSHNTSTYSIVCNGGIYFTNTNWNGNRNSELVLSGGSFNNTVNQTTLTGNFAIRPDNPVTINTSILIPNGYQIRYLDGASTVSVAAGVTLSLGQNLGIGAGITCSTHPIIWNDIFVPQNIGSSVFLGSTLSSNGMFVFNNTLHNQPFTYSLTLGYLNPLNILMFRTTGTTQSYLFGPMNGVNVLLFTSSNTTGTTLTLNGGQINLDSLIQYHMALTASIVGTSNIRFKGSGTWSGDYNVSNNLIFDTGANTLVLDSDLRYNNGTLIYTSGLINSTQNTLTVNGNATFSTLGMNWNNVNIIGTSSGVSSSIRNIYFGNTFSVSGILSLTGSINFIGPGGFYVNNLYSSGTFTYSLAANSIYTVTNVLTLQGIGTASRMNLVSNSLGTYSIFNLNQGASHSVNYILVRDINSLQGRVIRNYRGSLSNTLNWLIIPTTYTTFSIDGL